MMRIIICDDHVMFSEALADFLTSKGHEVIACLTSPARLDEVVRESRPDAVLLDVSFPAGCGLEAASAVRLLDLGTRVILCTGDVDQRVQDALDTRLVDAVVAKADDVAQIDRALSFETRRLRPRRSVPARVRPRDPLADLTPRELQILDLLALGHSTIYIGRTLGIATSTVHAHVQSVLRQLGVSSRLQAVHLYLAAGTGMAGTATAGRRGA